MVKFLTVCLAFVLVVTIIVLSLGNEMVFAEANTITPVVEYTIYEPSQNETYTNTMMIRFSYDVSYKDSGAKSLGRTNCYSIDGEQTNPFPQIGMLKMLIFPNCQMAHMNSLFMFGHHMFTMMPFFQIPSSYFQ